MGAQERQAAGAYFPQSSDGGQSVHRPRRYSRREARPARPPIPPILPSRVRGRWHGVRGLSRLCPGQDDRHLWGGAALVRRGLRGQGRIHRDRLGKERGLYRIYGPNPAR